MSALTLRRSAAPSRSGPVGVLAGLSTYPTVDLLPPAVRERRALQALRGRLGLGLVLVVLVIALGFIGSIVNAATASSAAAAAEDERLAVQAQLATYSEAAQVRSQIESITSAVATVMGTEVLWADQMRAIETVLPIDQLTAFGASTVDASGQTETPFTVSDAVGASTITLTTPSLPDLAAMLDALETVPGIASATFTSSDADEAGVWTTSGSITFGPEALSGRYTTDTSTTTTTEEAGS